DHNLHVSDVPALLQHHHADDDIVGVVQGHHRAVVLSVLDLVAIDGIHRRTDLLPLGFVGVLLLPDVNLHYGRAGDSAGTLLYNEVLAVLRYVALHRLAREVVPRWLAVGQEVRHLRRFGLVAAEDEENGLAVVAFGAELVAHLAPSLYASREEVLVL